MPERNLPRYGAQDFIKKFLNVIFSGRKKQIVEELPQEGEEERNPYLYLLREILEQILAQRGIAYEQFAPVLIDGSDPQYTLWAAKLLVRDLNRMTILTDNAAYFEEYADNMYEEQGLVAEIFPKDKKKMEELSAEGLYGNVILDFEDAKEGVFDIKFGKKIYIPIFKRKWECPGNLDITVPIGYNTMTVRTRETVRKMRYPDRFERAFYENE